MYCYRFPDRATFLSAAETAGFTVINEENETMLQAYSPSWAIDEIGPIVTTPGTYDEDGNELTPPIVDDRHHVNLLGQHPDSWNDHLVIVNSPSRIWAGHSTGPSDDPNAPTVDEGDIVVSG